MQKALELFDQIEDIDENPYHKTRTIIFDRDDMAFIKEAREELEALQQRSCCDGCVREAEDMVDPHCAFCSRACKDNYESKEQ